ncbi:ER membrane protein SH3 [Spinellus fusiger]|nr:ER membrane protein SH3 [Spinellus fusiger]
MPREHMQSTKVVLILCSCFFSYGTHWSDWAFDYYMLWANPMDHPEAVSRAVLYYTTQVQAPDILKYIPFVNLIIAAFGFAAGLANMTDGNVLFDGASLVLMLFGLSTYATSVKPALATITSSTDEKELISSLKNIAAAHFIIVLAITGIIGLQVAHFLLSRRASSAENETPAVVEKKDQ